jgi:hypothetical protein
MIVTAMIDEPTITRAEIGPGHDGRPEVIVTLAYANGATTHLSLEQEVVEQVIARADITDLAQLAGRPWSVLFPMLMTAAPPSPFC